MKKIIFTLVLTLSINGSIVKAGVNEDYLINVAKSTIEKARKDGSGITFITKHVLENNKDITSQTTTNEDSSAVSILSNMRAQAELSYSNNNSYGKTTSSCFDGMFKTDLKNQITGLFKYTKNVKCAVKTTKTTSNWAVTAKIPNGSFWCVDSNGNRKVIGALLPSGSTSCDKAVKAKTKIVKEKSFIDNQTTIYPKLGGVYDAYFTNTVSLSEKKYKDEVILKDGTTYHFLNSNLLAYSDFTKQQRTSFQNKYIAVPLSTSLISKYYGLNPKNIDFMIDAFLKSGFTAILTKSNSDNSKVYAVTVPVTAISDSTDLIKFLSLNSDLFMRLYFFDQKTITYNVTVKDNIIISIKASTVLTNKTGKDLYTMTASQLNGSVSAPLVGDTVLCNQLWSPEIVGAENVCDPITEETIAADKKKTDDAIIKSNLSSMRAQAEFYYSNTNDYGPRVNNCESGIFSSPSPYGMVGLVTEVKSKTGDMVCKSDNTSWFVSAKLVTGPWFCVDSTGIAQEIRSQRSVYDTKCN